MIRHFGMFDSSFPYHRVNLWGYTPPGDEKLDEHKEKKAEKKVK